MRLFIPVMAGFLSGVLATKLGFSPNELDYWLISGPFILIGGLAVAFMK